MKKDREWHRSEKLSFRNRLTLIGVRRIVREMGYKTIIKKDILIVDTGKKHYYLDVYDEMWRMRYADPYLMSDFVFLPNISDCIARIAKDPYPEYDYPNVEDHI